MNVGLWPLLAVGTLARIPVTANAIGLTLQVVLGLHRDYAAAGLVSAAVTIGVGVGGPIFGYLVDRRGLRTVLALAIVWQAVFWVAAPELTYAALAVAALASGFFSLQANVMMRQCIAAVVPEAKRPAAYALDAVSTEISFMLGPLLAAFVAATVSPRILMIGIGVGNVVAAATFAVLNPPVNARSESASADKPGEVADGKESISRRPRIWVTPGLLGVCAVGSAGMIVLGGTEVAVIAGMRDAGQVAATGVVFAAWSASSIAGGLIAARLHRLPSARVMLALLALCTAPIGLAGLGWWQLSLALVPNGALCAPTVGLLAADVNRHAPPDRCGTAMGLYSAATTAGLALGVLVAGSTIDAASPAWGFAAVGAAGLVAALLLGPPPRRIRLTCQTTSAEVHPRPGS